MIFPIQNGTMLLTSILVSLTLTIFIEIIAWKSIVGLSKEFKLEHIFLAIIAINIATNPAINIILSIIDPIRNQMFLEIGLELCVIIIEASLLYLIYKKAFGKFLVHSAIMNTLSYIMSLFIFRPKWL